MTNATTKTMTAKETLAWLNAYFFATKVSVNEDFTEIYKSSYTRIYEWDLDENVEVIEAFGGFDAAIEDFFYIYTVNFYDDKFSGMPYRTGTVRIDGIC